MFAEVLLPLPFDGGFTYHVPQQIEAEIKVYCRVIVPFGAKLFYTGIVVDVFEQKPQCPYDLKDIALLLDGKPMCRPLQFNFWKWVSIYYLCPLGDVFKCATPPGLIPGGGAGQVKDLLQKGFKPKTESIVKLSPSCHPDMAKHALSRAKMQLKLLDDFLDLQKKHSEISRNFLLESSGCQLSILNALVKRGLLLVEEKVVGRIDVETHHFRPTLSTTLTEAQQKAYDGIRQSFQNQDISLLHGVTSSGKTEIYIRLIADVLAAKRQALYLLPEIAVTTQMTERLKRVFGTSLLIYHSGITDNERAEIWNHLMESDNPIVVLGIRSSVFLPFARLGLIVVDEEHEPSYKQQEPAPRYHARHSAMMLAKMHGAKVLLGSATPSLDSYIWAINRKYGYIRLENRYGEVPLPKMEIVDVREQRRKRLMKHDFFSPLLIKRMDETLSRGGQIILFQNHRGFAPVVACQSCGEVPHCKKCDVSLTYHKQRNRLVCHYCGFSMPIPQKCPSCGSSEIRLQGFGTEKVEEEAAALFPQAAVARLDWDSTRSRTAYQNIISDFEAGRTQILIGTQMITKGLDFANVDVVGILNMDALLNVPDFRAYERAFQMMLQVSGRAGRGKRQGTVIVQTTQSETPIFQIVASADYQRMAYTQLNERHQFFYPPYSRLIEIVLRCKDETLLEEIAEKYSEKLLTPFPQGVSLPILPPISRIHNVHIRKIILKINLSLPSTEVRKRLAETKIEMSQIPSFRKIQMFYNVDPP